MARLSTVGVGCSSRQNRAFPFYDAVVSNWEGPEGAFGLPDINDQHVVAAALTGGAARRSCCSRRGESYDPHRHFATRQELAAVVYEDNVVQIEQRAAELTDVPDGILQLFDLLEDMQIENRSFAAELADADIDWFTALVVRTEAAFEALLAPARKSRLIRFRCHHGLMGEHRRRFYYQRCAVRHVNCA